MLDTATTFLQGQLSVKLSTHYPCSRTRVSLWTAVLLTRAMPSVMQVENNYIITINHRPSQRPVFTGVQNDTHIHEACSQVM